MNMTFDKIKIFSLLEFFSLHQIELVILVDKNVFTRFLVVWFAFWTKLMASVTPTQFMAFARAKRTMLALYDKVSAFMWYAYHFHVYKCAIIHCNMRHLND